LLIFVLAPVLSCSISIVNLFMTKVFIRYYLGKFVNASFSYFMISRSFFTKDFQIFYRMTLLKFLQPTLWIFTLTFSVQLSVVYYSLFHDQQTSHWHMWSSSLLDSINIWSES
jgi:hypothetical protein